MQTKGVADRNIPRVSDVLLPIFQIHRVDLTVSYQCDQPASSYLRATPMCETLFELARCSPFRASNTTNQVGVDSRLDRQRPACPCQQSAALSNHPIHRAIEIHHSEGGRRGPHGDKSCNRACRRDLSMVSQYPKLYASSKLCLPSDREKALQQQPFGTVRERSVSRPPAACQTPLLLTRNELNTHIIRLSTQPYQSPSARI